ncbi:3812_t:CDS:2, partial [Gigaspora margarita]
AVVMLVGGRQLCHHFWYWCFRGLCCRFLDLISFIYWCLVAGAIANSLSSFIGALFFTCVVNF